MNTNPLPTAKRINELDLFRGFAILGIFMVNILVMNVSFVYREEWEMEQTGWLQQASFFVLQTLFYGKFFTIFSFLFGIGVALQIQRAKEKGSYSTVFFLRRFGSLFLIGIAHILFIWSGDILHLYGMLGLVLLLFFQGSAKFLLWSAVVVFIFPFYTPIFEQCMEWLSFDYTAPLGTLSREAIQELKHNGSFWSGILLRIKEYAFAMGLVYSGITPLALTMMLLGGYVVRTGWMNNLQERLKRSTRFLLGALLVLLIYRFFMIYWIIPTFDIQYGSALSITLYTLYLLSDVMISFSLLWLVGYLWTQRFFHWLLAPLQYVGRMALSNYIFQSVVGYLIMRTFNGYEYFTPFGCMLLVLGVFSIQVVMSKYWLNYFQFGPLEWFWRCISYMKVLPIRKIERS